MLCRQLVLDGQKFSFIKFYVFPFLSWKFPSYTRRERILVKPTDLEQKYFDHMDSAADNYICNKPCIMPSRATSVTVCGAPLSSASLFCFRTSSCELRCLPQVQQLTLKA